MKKLLFHSLTVFLLMLWVLDSHAQEVYNLTEKNINQQFQFKSKRQERKAIKERKREMEEEEENEEYDGPDKAALFEFERTKDPATGKVPRERLLDAITFTKQSRNDVLMGRIPATTAISLSWNERGPSRDAVGASNGNSRANSGISSGRVRAVMVDSTDLTYKTVWVGGVDGGLWKTTDITASPANWSLVNDYLSNLAITDICQDPTNYNTIYFCTGEAYYNADAVKGNGVYKSTDRGNTWTQLSTTSAYGYCTRILCDYQGNIYLATSGNGLLRSVDGGNNWTTITPTGLSNRICDLEISSTSGPGRLHVVAGIFTAQAYRYTDIPVTVSAGTWTAPTTPFPTYNMRAEIAVQDNVLYALPADATYQVPTIYKSTDGGNIWTATAAQPASGWASGQGWYALSIDINPSNTNQVIIGGLESYKTTNGGASWTKISTWVGTTGQYVHADIHKILWYDGGNKLLWGCDGGIHYSADGGTTIRDRNSGLRIKQFYSCAIHPTSTTNPNYFLAGAQDNGVHQLNGAGLTTSVEVTGGDGCFVAIDQNEPQYQFGSYVYNTYRRSTNSGSTWASCNFYKGSILSSANFGSFINPFDYDNANNIIYAAADAGEIFRWTTALTTASGNYYSVTGFPSGASILTGITSLNSSKVSTVNVSPFTSHRVYFGTSGGRVIYLDNANTAASGSAGVNITNNIITGSVSSINFGTTEQYLIMGSSNYGVNSVWVSANGGTNWTNIEGNLPDMPVRWVMYYPGDNNKAIIATEMGVFTTDLINGSATVWNASPSFPAVRTDMLKFRTDDRTLLAATHGRGLWTTTLNACAATNSFSNITKCPNQLPYLWNGNSYQAAGSYSYTTTNSAGCDSIAILVLTISSNSSSTTNISKCPSQLPYSWNGSNYALAGTYSYTTTNSVGCDSVAILILTVLQNSSSSISITKCQNQLPYFWNGTNYMTSGTYSFTTTNSKGCDSVAVLHLTTLPVSNSNTSYSVCSNQLPYSWNGNNYSSNGSYTFSTTNSAGCDSIAVLFLTVKDTSSSISNVSVCSSQLPYNWNGSDYSTAGIYSFVTTNANGCDSMASLSLTILATTTNSENISLCSNQLPYLWHGTNYTTEGIYTFTSQNAVGCDSVEILNLQIGYTISSEKTDAICANQLPYTWNGNNYTASGTYSYTINSSNGCDSVAILSLTVLDTSSSSTQVSICSGQVPYFWNGMNYSSSGTYTFISTNAAGCDSFAVLLLTVKNTTSSTSNVIRCSNQLPYSWNGTNYSSTGTYTYIATNAAGCDSFAVLKLTVINTSSSTTNVTRCNNQLPYLWNGANYNIAGTYSFTTTNSIGCDSVATLVFSVTTTSSSTTNANRCTNQLPYSWNGTNYSTAGTYSYTTINSNGCDSIAILNLTINSLPIVNAGTYASLFTNSLPITLSGSPSGGIFSGVGVTSNTFSPSISGPGVFLISYNYTDPSTGCSNVATTNITVSAVACNFSVGNSINGNVNVCRNIGIGDSAIYSIASNDATSFAWSVSDGVNMGMSSLRTGSSVKIKFTSGFTTGTISVVIKGCDGATITKTLSVSKTIPGAPAAITGAGGSSSVIYICPYIGGSNLTYIASPPLTEAAAVISYRWTLPTGAQLVSVNAADSSSITIRFATAPSTLLLSVIAVSGCGNSSSRSITLDKTAPVAPSSISGLTDVCAAIGSATQSSNINYTVSPVNNASSYTWTVPTGATLVSGQGTTSINVVFLSTFSSGNITVRSVSTCGTSNTFSQTVYKRQTTTPVAIQKQFTPTSVAAVTSVCGLVSETYRIRKVAYATSYNWSLKQGTKATLTRLNAVGINDTAIQVTFLSGFARDTISVTAVSPCNISTALTLPLSALLAPPTPTSITSSTGSYNACIGNTITYTVVSPTPTSTQSRSTIFRWTRPNNTTITSASTDSASITVRFNTGYTGGNLTATGQSACGIQGTAKTQALTHRNCPAGTGNIPITKLNADAPANSDGQLMIYPNPNNGEFDLVLNNLHAYKNENADLEIFDASGKLIRKYIVKNNNGTIKRHFVEPMLSNGIYTLFIKMNGFNKEVKFIIQKGAASILDEHQNDEAKK